MIRVKTNIPIVNANILRKLEILQNREYLLRPVCFDVIVLMTDRIHKQGKKQDGTPIGTYSSTYLRFRQDKHRRTSDPMMIVSLTRQLENDWSVIATPKGYAIGFKNEFNKLKAKVVEEGATPHTVKAHTRTLKTVTGRGRNKKVEIKAVPVKAYQNKGWIGHGTIFRMTETEQEFATKRFKELIADALNS